MTAHTSHQPGHSIGTETIGAEETQRAEMDRPETHRAEPGPADAVARRRVLRGAAVAGLVGAAGVGLAACGSGDEGGSGTAGSGDSGGGGGSGVRVASADVPVGGGTILKKDKVVVTQPKKGQFKAFSAVCTHQGCIVNKVANDTISCPCHGSQFSAEDGAVTGGPAPSPLPGKKATVEGSDVVVG